MDATKDGLKRKRYEPPEEELSVRIGGKIHHEKKEVQRASKRAKVFETQKVVRRLKDLRKKDEDSKAIEGFEAELASLKGIDHDAIGNSAFKSKILKDHALRDNEDIKATMTKELESNLVIPAETGTTLSKIQSRLLSSKILAAQVAASVESLKILLNPALKQRLKTEQSDNIDTLERPSKIRKESNSTTSKTKKQTSSHEPTLEDEENSDSVDEAGWESGSSEDEAVSDDGWESGSIIGSGPEDREGKVDQDEDASDSDQESDGVDEVRKVKVSQDKSHNSGGKTGKAASTAQSTFLPSLSVGFVRGSDDSDWSETEDKAGDMLKKNRRGQRARRAIWEKKFGRNANHKKKEAEERAVAVARKIKGHTTTINTGSNAIHSAHPRAGQGPTGATGGNLRDKDLPQRQQPVDGGWGDRSTGGPRPADARRIPASKHVEKPLHPSWEAKRKLKERESVAIVPSQGKKIKF